MRANLLVELFGLSRQEHLMAKTVARAQTTDECATVLVQHHSIVHIQERLLTEKSSVPRTGYKPWSDKQQYGARKYGYVCYGYDENDVVEPDQGIIPEGSLRRFGFQR